MPLNHSRSNGPCMFAELLTFLFSCSSKILFLSYAIFIFSDEEVDEPFSQPMQESEGPLISGNPFLSVPNISSATEFKKGYIMRKRCFDLNGKKSKMQ